MIQKITFYLLVFVLTMPSCALAQTNTGNFLASQSGDKFIYFKTDYLDTPSDMPDKCQITVYNETFVYRSVRYNTMIGNIKSKLRLTTELKGRNVLVLTELANAPRFACNDAVQEVQNYFGGVVMRQVSSEDGMYKGPWEQRSTQYNECKELSAEIDGIALYSVTIHLECSADGTEFVTVWSDIHLPISEQLTSEGVFERVRQQFYVVLQNGKPVVKGLEWVKPLPCGQSEPINNRYDIWNKYAQRYVADLDPRLQKYFDSGIVSEYIAGEAKKVVQKPPPTLNPCGGQKIVA